MVLFPLGWVAFMALLFFIDQLKSGKTVGAIIAGTILVVSVILMFPLWKWSKRKDHEQEEAKRQGKEPTKSEKLAGEIASNSLGNVFVQVLSLMFFFFAVVAVCNHLVIWFVILFLVGALGECLFLHLLRTIRKLKAQKAEEDLHPTDPVKPRFAEALYKNKGYTYDIARELYCRQHGKAADALTEDDEKAVWDYSFDDFTYLLTWIIEKNFYQPSEEEGPLEEEEAKQIRSLLGKIKRRTMLPSEFLSGSDGYFMEDEIKKKARPFVKEYYESTYPDEVKAFSEEHLKAELYGFPFRWEDYDAFKDRIDEAYQRYLEETGAESKAGK